jgi:hypothetical protein
MLHECEFNVTTPAGQTIHFLLRWASGARVFGQSSRIQVLLVFSGCSPSTAQLRFLFIRGKACQYLGPGVNGIC